MKNFYSFLLMFFCALYIQAQYNFPSCYPEWDASNNPYKQGQEVSYNSINYKCKYYTNDAPGAGSWEQIGPCGDGGLGPDYSGKQRIIGYLPTWVAGYDIKNDFKPEVVTHLNISFLMFKQNNNDYNSADFASIAFDEFQERKVDSVLNDLGVLQKSKDKGVKVSVALGGATDYAFLWLMTKYYKNDAKIDEIATLIANYVNQNDIDGIDLDMECWWADKAISGTSDQGGRVRGSKWGDRDQGPHPAGIGLTKLSQKLRAKIPNKLITAAVFGTSWYGNNYDDGIADHMDWIGLMSYDFTGSWDKSPEGPHSSLYKVPLGIYTGQTADNPIYSAQDALEYWMGLAPPAWNHAGGFKVPKAKLAFGLPVYGYDFSEKKPNGGNGAKFVPYKDIIKDFPNAATSYNPKDPDGLGGYIGENGKKIYYNTPKMAAEKAKYSKQYGHQGLIVWELTQDVDYNSSSSILRAVNNGATINDSPKIVWETPANNEIIELEKLAPISLKAKATDSDGTVQSFSFKHNGNDITATANGNTYTASFTPTAFGEVKIVASATDDKDATSEKTIVFTVKEKVIVDDMPPSISMVTPEDNSVIEQKELSSIQLEAKVTDDNEVSSVVFVVNDVTLTPSVTGDMYTANWTPSAFGEVSYKVMATDNNDATTEVVTMFTVKEKVIVDNTPPSITKVIPEDKSVIEQTELSSIQLEAKITDDTEVASVVFKVNDAEIATSVTGDMYTANWTPSAFGEVSYKITATDNEGASTEVVTIFTVKEKVIIGDCNGIEAWDANKVYASGGQKVSYNGNVYTNKWWTKGETPGSSDVWEFVSDCNGGGQDDDFCGSPKWISSKAYNSGDQVYYEKKIYKANWWTQGDIPGSNDVWGYASDCAKSGLVTTSNTNTVSFPTLVDKVINYQITTTKPSIVKISLYDLYGKSIKTTSFKRYSGSKNFEQDLSTLKSGIYIYKINIDGDVLTKKIIKK